jgi:hypothetical protein
VTYPRVRPYGAGGGGPVSALTLGTSAPWLRLADGRVWRYRYASALELLSRTDAEQDAYLDWAQAERFTGVRVLTTHAHKPPLPPELGRARLPALFNKLRARGMGAELVALADTKPQGFNRDTMAIHVASIGRMVEAASLPLSIELFNENAHPTQVDDATDVAFLRELRALIPAPIPVSLGSCCCGLPDTVELYSGGDYSTPHLDRSRGDYAEVARIKHFYEWPGAKRLVANDEGIGAAEASIPGKRSANPSRFFAQGILDRLGDLGSTFHFDDGVPAVVPRPNQQTCARAYIDGATLVEGDDTFRFVNDSTGGAITHGADWSKVFKLFGFINQQGGPSYLVALGVTGDYAPVYVNGWRPVRVVADRPGVQVIEVTR